jgi:hypothetical protein
LGADGALAGLPVHRERARFSICVQAAQHDGADASALAASQISLSAERLSASTLLYNHEKARSFFFYGASASGKNGEAAKVAP